MKDDESQMPLPGLGLLADIGEFLSGLKAELPEIFPAARESGLLATLGGKELPVRERREPGTKTRVEPDGDGLTLVRGGDGQRAKAALREFYQAHAVIQFRERTRYWAVKMGLVDRVKRVTIKDQNTLWGSCSEVGNLNFNWRVVMAPPEVLDYLVIHELAHLREMNHSARFWSHVSEHCADYKVRRKWLRENARRLKSA
jgi:predicted metal-dependent hydrolase